MRIGLFTIKLTEVQDVGQFVTNGYDILLRLENDKIAKQGTFTFIR